MSNKIIPPSELNWVTTFLCVKDAAASLNFYTNEFKFTEHQVVKNNRDEIIFARITYNQTNFVIMTHAPFAEESHRGVSPAISNNQSPISIYVYCTDVEERYQHVKALGLNILLPINIRFWGDKTFRVKDHDGYIWDFATPVADFDPSRLPPELK